jgi:hypothetical protein
MFAQLQPTTRRLACSGCLRCALAVLALMQAMTSAHSQNQPVTPENPGAGRPTTPAPTQVPRRTNQNGTYNSGTPAHNSQMPPNSAPKPSIWNRMMHPGGNNTMQGTRPGTESSNPFKNMWNKIHHPSPGPSPAPVPHPALPHPAPLPHSGGGLGPLSKLDSSPSGSNASQKAVQSQMFVGHPAPPGSREVQAPNGNIVRTGPDGAVMDVRNPRNNMSIHHAPDGSRQITVDRPDGSRIFAASHGASYVQHPYQFQKSTFDSRTYYQGGKITQQFYRRYTYGGTTLDAYVPQRFYDPRIYQWALNSNFREPMIPSWNFVATPTPWFNYYKSYFTPQPYYTNALTWLTDYLIANSLVAAWNAHGPASSTPLAPAPASVAANSPTPPASAQSAAAGNAQAPAAPAASAAAEVTPETKQKVTEEVSRQISEESAESRENAQHKEPQPGTVGIVAELSRRGEEHVFVVASDLDLVDDQARRCTMSEGDVVQAISGPDPATASAQAKVLASKGQGECERAAQVTIALTDLQDMQNHMRETIDQGLADRTGMKGVQATTAAVAASPPPADPDVAREIEQQKKIAAAEG